MIKQIMSAPGWYAVYRMDEDEESWVPLACWVLVEPDDNPLAAFVDGMDLEGEGADGDLSMI